MRRGNIEVDGKEREKMETTLWEKQPQVNPDQTEAQSSLVKSDMAK